jgi:hypothetical protein
MKLITYATSKAGYLEALEKSATRNGFDIIILGQGKKWIGWTQKFMDIGEYLDSLPDKEEIVCFVDGYDCVVLGTSEEMMRDYKKKKTDKVILSTDIFDDNLLFNRLNSGCYLGKIAKIQELLKNVCMNGKQESKDLLELDSDHDFFYNLPLDVHILYWKYLILTNQIQDYEAPLENRYYRMEDQKRLLISSNQKRPIILRRNGNLNMNKIVQYLDLPIAIENKSYYNHYLQNVKKKHRVLFKVLYVIFQIIHILVGAFIYFFIFFTQSPFWISFFIVLWFCIIIQWYIYKNCVLSYVENFLDEKEREKQENDAEYSFLQDLFIRVFGEKFSFYLTTAIIPLSLMVFAVYKLNRVVCSTTIVTKTKKK